MFNNCAPIKPRTFLIIPVLKKLSIRFCFEKVIVKETKSKCKRKLIGQRFIKLF